MSQSIRQYIYHTVFAAAIFFLYGCAASYKPIVPSSFPYTNEQVTGDSLLVSYATEVQRHTDNRWYYKKEVKHQMTAIALKIENLSSNTVVINVDNFKFFSGDHEVVPISPTRYSQKVKQRVGRHLLHALYGPWGIQWQTTADGETDTDFYYIPVGAAIGIGNAVTASKANKENHAAIAENLIWGQRIESGKTIYGLITMPRTFGNDLSFQYYFTKVESSSAPVEYPVDESHFRTQLNSGINNPFDFYVIMNDTRTSTVKSEIFTGTRPHYIQANGGPKITPDQTTSISRMDEAGRQILGIPHGDVWLFKMIAGRISTYYPLSEGQNLFTHIQKDDGVIIPFTPQALKEMVEDDPAIIDIIIQKGDFLKAIKKYNKHHDRN